MRMGRRKFKKLLDDLQRRIRRSKRVDGISKREYRARKKALVDNLKLFQNIFENYGKNPLRFPRT